VYTSAQANGARQGRVEGGCWGQQSLSVVAGLGVRAQLVWVGGVGLEIVAHGWGSRNSKRRCVLRCAACSNDPSTWHTGRLLTKSGPLHSLAPDWAVGGVARRSNAVPTPV
jgi:hypothetical protein